MRLSDEVLDEILGGDEASPTKLYERYRDKFKPILDAFEALGPRVGRDFAPAVVGLIQGLNEVLSDPAVSAASDQLGQTLIEMRFKALKSYQAAGFTRAEAFALVRQDAANFKAVVADVVGTSKKK